MRLKLWLWIAIPLLFLSFLSFNALAANPGNPPASYLVTAKGIGIILSPDGNILRMRWGKNIARGENFDERSLIAFSGIAGCHQQGGTIVRKNKEGGLLFTRNLVNDSLHQSCISIEKFIPAGNSIRWELEIRGRGLPWSGEINTDFEYPATEQTRFWTTWGAPQFDSTNTDKQLLEDLKPVHGGSVASDFMGPGNNQWVDPLVAVPFADRTYFYGLPYFTYQDPRIAVCPFQGNLFCIPMCSVLEPREGSGVTFALSPGDDLIDLVMTTNRKGLVRYSRLFNRISADHPLRFVMDITAHAADWRAGLGWMTARYPAYFLPKNKVSYRLAGTGAYAGPFEIIQNRKMRAMDFTTNWEASFDFPYMGMFLPPVKRHQRWKRFGDSAISMHEMEEYARGMKKSGFHVLNYFNVTEFGAHVKYPAPSNPPGPETGWWRDCNTFIYHKLSHAIFPVPVKMRLGENEKSVPGGPMYTWEDGIVMDCGDPTYKNFLLGQAQRHILEIHDADGICIDRMDWLRMFNEQADDGRTWFGDKPVRSLLHSFKELMDTLGPLMHQAGKSIFVNNHDKRIDLLKQADGIFDEFTYAGAPLNLSAFLCVEKPALGWTDEAATVKREGVDNFFQKYLYMGVFPMCPYPANDHSIMPDSLVDGYYIEYAPLLRLMRGRKWVLRPHVIAVENGMAKANLFAVPGGYVIPVVYGKVDHVKVILTIGETDGKDRGRKIASFEVWYPGKKEGLPIKPFSMGKTTVLEVPLTRGCAMVSVRYRDL